MVVSTCADRLGKDDAAGVDGLEDAVEVAQTGDLLDENRGKTFSAELLVYAEEIDLGGVEDFVSNA